MTASYINIPKLIRLIEAHPDNGFVFDASVNPPTFTLSREELEKLIEKAEVKKE